MIINKESFIVVIKFGLSGLLSWPVSGYAQSGERGSAIWKWRGISSSPFGCKLQILVSLWVFGMESHCICPFRCHLGLSIKIFTKNALTLTTHKSPLGVSLSLSHTHIGLPWGFNLDFPTSGTSTRIRIFLKVLTFLHKSAFRPQGIRIKKIRRFQKCRD